MARQTRMSFPNSTSFSSKPFDLLHLDLWGPYHMPTHDHYKYFLTIVDDHSRSTWVHLLSCKSNTLQVIKVFVKLIKTQFQTTIKAIRLDNGLEFTSKEAIFFYQSKGIVHKKFCPYTPQQNGVVERKHNYLLEVSRSFLFQSKVPLRYWGECILTATYLINRLPSTVLKGKCPYELLYLHILTLKLLGVYVTPQSPNLTKISLNPGPFLMCLWDTRFTIKGTRFSIYPLKQYMYLEMSIFLNIFFLLIFLLFHLLVYQLLFYLLLGIMIMLTFQICIHLYLRLILLN
ncbi:hypothetical protein AABB24_024872 [Solanum stoloniferum]|uniref:Integrase catalytic domain-containing protein n=1 Tax=Solanum stoloniferum TaxID=62892 RepID=A0ABD2SQM0_9SOLN